MLAGALSSSCTQLRELDLSDNDFTESGVKALCVGLRSQHCKLETVRLFLADVLSISLRNPNIHYTGLPDRLSAGRRL